MHPTLIEIGPITLYSYGFFIAAAFLAGLGWTMREARQRGLEPAFAQDLAFAIFIGAIVGSRALYVLLELDYFLANPLDVFMFWKGGLVFSGGALVAAAATLWLVKRRGDPPFLWADSFAPGIALGQFIGRMGCLMAGCCYGAECELPWAVVFSDADSLAPLYVPIHPTQAYHSLAGLTTFIVLMALKKSLRDQPGRLMGVFLLLYPAFRFTIEFFRGDFRGHVLEVFSTTQVIAACLFCLGLWLVLRRTGEANDA